MSNRFPLVAMVVVCALAAPAFAWSNKEHIQLTRIAAMRLVNAPDTPAEMKQWLREAMPGITDMAAERAYFMTARVGMYPTNAQGLAFWATVPDLDVATARGNDPVKPFPVPERLLHYIDLEFFHADESKRVYADDLSNKAALENVPRDMTDERYKRAGMLPFRVEQCYREVVKNLKDGRLV